MSEQKALYITGGDNTPPILIPYGLLASSLEVAAMEDDVIPVPPELYDWIVKRLEKIEGWTEEIADNLLGLLSGYRKDSNHEHV